jgi:threonine dehydrogenase-like Zn-dependent dehydrogenase
VIQLTSDYLSDAQRVLIIKMKFLLLAVTIAVALAAAGDLSALTLAAKWNNATSGKLADSSCSITASATTVTHGLSANGHLRYNLWIVNSASATKWAVNTSVWYVNVAATYTHVGTVYGTATITASGYLVSKEITLGGSGTSITAADMTADAFGASAAGTVTATSYSATFNVTWKQFDHINNTAKLAEKAFVYYSFEDHATGTKT